MRPGQQLRFKQRVPVIPWGHPSLSAVALLLSSSPVPEVDASYFACVEPARERFASVGGRFELVTSSLDLPDSTLVLTDGYGEIFASWTSRERGSWPNAQELIEWLYYIASQCPECSPTEPGWRETTR